MRGLWLEQGAVRFRDDLPEPRPRAGEAVIEVLRAGLCNTDLELISGYYPFRGVLGHEFVGRVVGGDTGALPPGDEQHGGATWLGRTVVGEINVACGDCGRCRAGLRRHCARREVLGIRGRDGAFAERLCLPLANLHPAPAGVPLDALAFTEPLAAALEIREQVSIGADDRVLVVGDGKLGQLVAQTLALTGCDLLVIGRHAGKLGLLERRGIRIQVGGEPVAGAYDLAVDCTGSPQGFAVARAGVRPRGTLVLKSTYAGRLELDASGLVVDEIVVVGSRCGPFEPALAALAAGSVDVLPLIGARYPLAAAVEAIAAARAPGMLKVLLEVGSESEDGG